ncbi:Sec-independent protein translocase subunit TatA [Parathalassolituus penaei]|uniref:Sec-independent protein translocase protein TatA n=1 Tax=Parathalassolituus penaei TaxID=2997323 RepID=A0A9X3ITA7_9GAMM|nr:Sec-independent protein translocase subunit TatA [Parathalassolituus penaei]MCY0965003.1 Sec-independent protein translocase subunit TatA [Parathalassolituus penaei]
MIGGISIWQLLIILAIVIVIFGTKKLRNLGGDLGGAIKNFKSAMNEGEKPVDKTETPVDTNADQRLIQNSNDQRKDADFSNQKDQNRS